MRLRVALPLVFLMLLLTRALGIAQSYAPAVNYPAAAPQGLAFGDFNEDGNVDVVVADSTAASLTFFAGRGDGTLAAEAILPAGTAPYDLASGDFNGDGHLDLVVTLTNAKTFQVLFGNGNGTFQAPQSISIAGLASTATVGQVVVADLNHDNKPDVLIATDSGVAVFINTGGSFAQLSNLDGTKTVSNIAVGDLNSDGNLDVTLTESGFNANGDTIENVLYALGNGDGSFQPMSSVASVAGTPAGLVLADLNKDGRLDIVVSNSGGIVGI